MGLVKRLVKQIIPEKQRLIFWYTVFKVRGKFYSGNNVTCVCCDGNFSRFLPYGVPRRENAVCPSCHSLERNRLLWLYLQNEVKIGKKPLRILHFAPEPVLQKRLKEIPEVAYTSTDICSPFAMVLADIMDLPFADSSYDIVLCSHVLAHVEDDKKALQELYRILSPGGFILLQEWMSPAYATTLEVAGATTTAQRFAAYGQDDRCRIYGMDLPERLRSAGFVPEIIDYRAIFTPEEQYRYGLSRPEEIIKCTKPF